MSSSWWRKFDIEIKVIKIVSLVFIGYSKRIKTLRARIWVGSQLVQSVKIDFVERVCYYFTLFFLFSSLALQPSRFLSYVETEHGHLQLPSRQL